MMVDRGRASRKPVFRVALAWAISLAATTTFASTFDVTANGLSGTYLAARSADTEKDLDKAAFYYREVLERDDDNPYILERAMLLSAATGELDEAVPLAERIIEYSPRNWYGRFVLATDAFKGRSYKQALANIDAAGSSFLEELTGGLIGAWALMAQGEVDEALTRIADLEGEAWYEPFKLLHSGHIALASGRTDTALGQFRQAYERDRNAIRVIDAYARALALAGQRDEAMDVVDDFLIRIPGNPSAKRLKDDLSGDQPVGASIRTPSEGVAEVLSGLGVAINEDGGVELAALYLRLALHLDPQSSEGMAVLALGNLLARNDQHEAAIAVFETIEDGEPFSALVSLRAAASLDQLDRVDEAEARYLAIADKDPSDFQTYFSYANMLRLRNRHDDSIESYSRAIDLIERPSRNHWVVYFNRGIAYERTKQWEEAEADFKMALELSPDQPSVLNYLGYSWVDMGLHLEPALEMIRKAVELRPSDGYIVDSLGWAYYKLGRYDEAVVELERAVSLMPDDPVINDHLGDAYWKVGRILEAQFQWRHARDLEPEDDDLKLIVRKIEEQRLIEEDELEGSNDDAFLESDDELETADGSRFHIVQPGDSLWTIAADVLGDGAAYPALLDANSDVLPSPDLLAPGMKIIIPNL